MKLNELFKETDALTFVNSLKVTLSEIKNEVSQMEEMSDYMSQTGSRIKKLMRKADNQYRVIAKLVQDEGYSYSLSSDIEINDEETDEIKSIMEGDEESE